MTDPVTNVEIEDVLSSIRRLVSENGRSAATRPTGRQKAQISEDKTKAPDALEASVAQGDPLVLTPALRVPEPDPVPEDDADPAAARQPDEVDAVTAGPVEPDGVETDDGHGLAVALESVVKDALDEALARATRDEADATLDTASAADASSLEAGSGESLKARIAELETVVARQEGDWEPDGDGEDAYFADSPVETLAWEDHVQDDTETDHATERVEAGDRLNEVDEAELVEVTDSDVGAAPEPVFSHVSETDDASPEIPEGRVEESDAVTREWGETPSEGLASDIAAREDAGAGEEPEATEENVDLFGADSTLIDEEMLREMVADIVRQELQGTLGERITRNVRKLVRREIHRALAAHELD